MALSRVMTSWVGGRRGGIVDDAQQALIDHVAFRQQLVEIHGAHDGTYVGHGQIDYRVGQIVDLVGRPRGTQNLKKHHAVHRHHGVVPGDDLLGRHVQHRLHHVHLCADLVEHGDDDVQARIQGFGVPAERRRHSGMPKRGSGWRRRKHGQRTWSRKPSRVATCRPSITSRLARNSVTIPCRPFYRTSLWPARRCRRGRRSGCLLPEA